MKVMEYFKWMFSLFYLIAEKMLIPPQQKRIEGGSVVPLRLTMSNDRHN